MLQSAPAATYTTYPGGCPRIGTKRRAAAPAHYVGCFSIYDGAGKEKLLQSQALHHMSEKNYNLSILR